MNFNMNKLEVTISELLNMLREVESTIKKEKPVLYTGETKKKERQKNPLRMARARGDRVKQKLLRRLDKRQRPMLSL